MFELEKTDIVDPAVRAQTVKHFKERGIVLPTYAQLADPSLIPDEIIERLAEIDPDEPHPLNLFRVHWFNDADRRGRTDVPAHMVLPPELTGVKAPIIVALGNRFPMITAHKVLAAYGCLTPRLLTGRFDPSTHRAIWPSTGNYCRGGVAISKIMGCRGVAVLPEGMSQERFDWLEHWATDHKDIIRTPGSESNVKEIYDCCNALAKEPQNVIFNQFSEFSNHLVHYLCTGKALERVYQHLQADQKDLRVTAFVSATGSGGSIAAGDYLKEKLGSATVAVEAAECPTLLYNGFGEHNIQGIGDKHVPLIHNVMGTDWLTGISDTATDTLLVLFNTEVGRRYLMERRGCSAELVESLGNLGISSICNILSAIKLAKHLDLGENEAIMTVATDDASMYSSELKKAVDSYFNGSFDVVSCGEVYGQHILGASSEHLQELSFVDRNRIFNLGYFTWVEQQGLSLEEFEARRRPEFWTQLRALLPAWDELIEEFNAEVQA